MAETIEDIPAISTEQAHEMYAKIREVFGNGLSEGELEQYQAKWDDLLARAIDFAHTHNLPFSADTIVQYQADIKNTPSPITDATVAVKPASEAVADLQKSDYAFKKYLLIGLVLLGVALFLPRFVKIAAGFLIVFAVVAFYMMRKEKIKNQENV